MARRPLVEIQAEFYFGMCQGDISLLFCADVIVVLSGESARAEECWAAAPLLSAANSWISSDPDPSVGVRKLWSQLLLNHLTAITRLSEGGRGLRKSPVEHVIAGL